METEKKIRGQKEERKSERKVNRRWSKTRRSGFERREGEEKEKVE